MTVTMRDKKERARFDKALMAMQILGIPSHTVENVLIHLLKLYGNNWKFIEAENYRALADSIFEYEEEVANNKGSKNGGRPSHGFLDDDDEEEDEDEEEEEEEKPNRRMLPLVIREPVPATSARSSSEQQRSVQTSQDKKVVNSPSSSAYRNNCHVSHSSSDDIDRKGKAIVWGPLPPPPPQIPFGFTPQRMNTHMPQVQENGYVSNGHSVKKDVVGDRVEGVSVGKKIIALKEPKVEVEDFNQQKSDLVSQPKESIVENQAEKQQKSHPEAHGENKHGVSDNRSEQRFTAATSLGAIAGMYSDSDEEEVSVTPEEKVSVAPEQNNSLMIVSYNSGTPENNNSLMVVNTDSMSPENSNSMMIVNNDSMSPENNNSLMVVVNKNSMSPENNSVMVVSHDDHDSRNYQDCSSSLVLYEPEKEWRLSADSPPELVLSCKEDPKVPLIKMGEEQSLRPLESLEAASDTPAQNLLPEKKRKSCEDEQQTGILAGLPEKPTDDNSQSPESANSKPQLPVGRVYKKCRSLKQGSDVLVRRSPRFLKNVDETIWDEKNKENLEASKVYVKSEVMDRNNEEDNERNRAIVEGKMAVSTSPMRTADDENQEFKHDISDITKGEETICIPIVNGETSRQSPAPFFYIPSNMVYQNANINFSLAQIGDKDCCRNCFGDCLNSLENCRCAQRDRLGFHYTKEGRLKKEFLDKVIAQQFMPKQNNLKFCEYCPVERAKNENEPDFCKGHAKRTFLRECNTKCGCSKNCKNRTVQQGIKYKLEVFYTKEGKGWGVRALEDIPRGAFVCEYVGEILTIKEFNIRTKEWYKKTNINEGVERQPRPVLLDAGWPSDSILRDEEALCLDATNYGNVARFLNHRCYDANLIPIPVEIESPKQHYYHVAFFTTSKIEAKEELTWDYGIDFNEGSSFLKEFYCHCGSIYCRDSRKIPRST